MSPTVIPPYPQRRCATWLAALLLVLAFPAWLLALNPARALQDYNIQAWFIEHGLPSNKVRGIVQSRDGYLWLATSQGIVRFDGDRFTTFNRSTHPVIQGTDFFAAVEARDGTLWFASENGLYRWRDGQFDRFTTEQGLAHNYVRGLSLTRDGQVVACTRRGFSFYRDGRFVTPGGEWSRVRGVGRAFLERADGSMLLGTTVGLWQATGDRVEMLSGNDQLRGEGFFSLLETPDGSAWVGHSDGVQCLRPDGTRVNFGPAQGLANVRVAALQHDRDGTLWIAGYAGLFRLVNGRIEAAPYREHFQGAPLHGLLEDREGGLWVAAVTGLFRLKDTMASSIGAAQGLAHTMVQAVYAAPDGTCWFGAWHGGVYRYDGGRATRVPALAPLDSDRVFSITGGPDNSIWIGSESGLYRLADGKLTSFFDPALEKERKQQLATNPRTLLSGVANNWITSLASDGAGGLWIATDEGLYHALDGKFRAYKPADGLPGDEFGSVIHTRSGDVWATLREHGVVRLHQGRWETFLRGRQLGPAEPTEVYEDGSGAIWVTTLDGGLNRYKNGRWRAFTAADGLVDNAVCGVIEDGLGYLWIAYPRGVMRIPTSQFDELAAGKRSTLTPHIFNASDGLPRGEIDSAGRPRIARTRDGRLLFATDLGVAVVDPTAVRINSIKPPVYIDSVLIDGTAADLSRPVVVPPDGAGLRIHYTGISLLAPEKVRFKVRLEPLDDDWIDVGALREVRYPQLPPGRYTLHAVASNNDGVWNDTGAKLAFTVQPRLYQTWWFIGLVVLACAATIAGFIRQRSRRAARAMATLTRLVDERTHELQAARDRAESAVIAKNESILALRQAQEEVAAERARFKFIFEAVPVGIALVHRSARPLHLVNPAHERITGIGRHLVDRPNVFDQATHPDDRARQRQLLDQFRAGEIDHFTFEKRYVHADGRVVWASLTRRMLIDPTTGERQSVTTLVDITERKEAEARLAETHRELLATSRQAGMAEVATGVLHNVGNALTSVNVSATLVIDQLGASKAASVRKLGALLAANATDLGRFFTEDSRGRIIPGYVNTLANDLESEQKAMRTELDHLRKNIDHIRDIVAMQQSYARVSGVMEMVPVVELVEDALRMNASSLVRHGLEVIRDYAERPVANTERHKVMQILVNLIRNAKYACDDSNRDDKKMTIRINSTEDRVRIAVIDNGVGIPAENLTRIFAHGFTTRRTGHGFGLHSGALVARELGGSLTAHSDGPGLGACFILELPLQPVPLSQ